MNLRDTSTDSKNLELLKLIYRFRQSLDLYRLIGLNVDSLKVHGASDTFWGFTQVLAHESMAITVCKIYEPEDKYERNSIPGVINSVASSELTDVQRREIKKFADKWAPGTSVTSADETLNGVLTRFRTEMETALARLRFYRNKVGAHSEPNIKIESLPSLGEFERLLDFAFSFYQVVSNTLIEVGPALVGARVEGGALRVFRKLGIENPVRTYPTEDATKSSA